MAPRRRNKNRAHRKRGAQEAAAERGVERSGGCRAVPRAPGASPARAAHSTSSLLLTLLSTLLAAGCASNRPPQPSATVPGFAANSIAVDPVAPAPITSQPAADPVAPMPGEGLEVRWWVVDDTEGVIGSALAPYVDLAFPSEARRSTWRSSGLRLARLSESDLATIEPAWPPKSQRFIRWVGWAPAWTEVFRGRRLGDERVAIDGRSITPPPGVGRLLARCWPAPPADPNAPPSIRLELAFQVQPAAERPDPFERPRVEPEETRGPLLRELTADLTLNPGTVLILTAEDPAAEWLGRAPRNGAAPSPTHAPSALGPDLERPISFGEAMLATPGSESDPRRLRAVIILIARAHRPYRLLP